MIRALRRHGRGIARCSRGTAAVEFAIISGVLIMLLMGIVDLGRAYYVRGQISFLADRAARRVLVQPAVTDEQLTAELREQFTAGDGDALGITLGTEEVGDRTYRTVTVTFPLTLFIPNLDSQTVSLDVTRRLPSG